MNAVDTYIYRKIDMLRKEFMIKLTREDIAQLKRCTTEYEADRVARAILNREWADWY